MSEEILSKPPDLTDPAVLAAECRTFAEGLERQAEASSGRSANTGHPFPEQFLRASARVLAAAAAFVVKHVPAVPEPVSNAADVTAAPAASEPPKPPEPVASGGKKR